VLLAELKAKAAEAHTLEEAVACCIDTLVKYVTGESELSRAFMMTSYSMKYCDAEVSR
jgi:hypothetical protein